jgi:hypothetical protein
MGELAITRAFGDKSFKMGIKAMLEEDADELGGAGGVSDEATKELTAPLVSAEPEIASIVITWLLILPRSRNNCVMILIFAHSPPFRFFPTTTNFYF